MPFPYRPPHTHEEIKETFNRCIRSGMYEAFTDGTFTEGMEFASILFDELVSKLETEYLRLNDVAELADLFEMVNYVSTGETFSYAMPIGAFDIVDETAGFVRLRVTNFGKFLVTKAREAQPQAVMITTDSEFPLSKDGREAALVIPEVDTTIKITKKEIKKEIRKARGVNLETLRERAAEILEQPDIVAPLAVPIDMNNFETYVRGSLPVPPSQFLEEAQRLEAMLKLPSVAMDGPQPPVAASALAFAIDDTDTDDDDARV